LRLNLCRPREWGWLTHGRSASRALRAPGNIRGRWLGCMLTRHVGRARSRHRAGVLELHGLAAHFVAFGGYRGMLLAAVRCLCAILLARFLIATILTVAAVPASTASTAAAAALAAVVTFTLTFTLSGDSALRLTGRFPRARP
jgi:hypothetical protein